SSRRRHTRWPRDWSSDVCSSDLIVTTGAFPFAAGSADSALVVTLAPGKYSAEVIADSGAGGVALTQSNSMAWVPPPAARRCSRRSEERRVGKGVDRGGGGRIERK